LHGYDGFLYSIGFLVSYLIVLFLIAEPVYHLGKYSLGDVLCARFPSNKVRGVIAFGTFIISLLFMVPQLVAAGLLICFLLFMFFFWGNFRSVTCYVHVFQVIKYVLL